MNKLLCFLVPLVFLFTSSVALAQVEEVCTAWVTVPAVKTVKPRATTPRHVHVPRTSKKGKRIKASTTKPLPTLKKVVVACSTGPKPEGPGFAPTPLLKQPQRLSLIPATASPQASGAVMSYRPRLPSPQVVEWLTGPLAVIPPTGFYSPDRSNEQSNDLPSWPPDGAVVDTPKPSQVPVPGTLWLLLGIVLGFILFKWPRK